MALQAGIQQVAPVLDLKINIVGVISDGRGAIAPRHCEQAACIIHGIGGLVLVNVGDLLIVGQLGGVQVRDQAIVVEPLGVVVGQNNCVNGLVAAGQQRCHQFVIRVKINMLHLRAGSILKGLLAIGLVGVVTLPVGNVQRMAFVGQAALVGGSARLGAGLLGCGGIFCRAAAGGQAQGHNQSQHHR